MVSDIKQKKVAEALRREISKVILYELVDPAISFVTVTRAEPSVDLKTAKVYVSIMAEEKEKDRVLRTLRKARGHIQSLIGKRLGMRYTPILSFCLDDSIKRGLEVSRLVDEVIRGDKGCQD